MSDNITPIRKQYLQIKAKHPNAILFFRLGDFYETFDGDAETASRELDIVLTARKVGKNLKVPMAGIPYHAVDNYLSRLIEKGYHVAICEQVGEQPKKGLFPREVVRVVTPGTVIEPNLLKGNQNNYLCAVHLDEKTAGFAYVDITTGEFQTTQFIAGEDQQVLRDQIMRLNPSELIIAEETILPVGISQHVTKIQAWKFEQTICEETIKAQYRVATLDGFGLKNQTAAISAAGAILQYIKETQSDSLKLLDQLSTYSISDNMILDASTLRNLELTETIRNGGSEGSLLNILDRTVTPMGQRLIRQWITKPLLNIEAIKDRQQAVTYFYEDGILRKELRSALKAITDLERLTNRIQSDHALPRDLTALKANVIAIPEVIDCLQNPNAVIQSIIAKIDPCTAVLQILEEGLADDAPATLQNSGVIKKGFSEKLDSIINSTKHARDWIANLEKVEKERTGIKTLKVGYNKVFGYYIEISRGNAASAPDEYIRKQTLVNAERFITPELKEFETLVLNAEDQIRELEAVLFQEICEVISKYSKTLLETARNIAFLDVLLSFSETASLHHFNCPKINDSTHIHIENGRHPVVEKYLQGNRFVPNDTLFQDEGLIHIVTGPNMSGKSTYLRQVALITLMAQIGSYVPAESAEIGLVDRIFTRIGAHDEIHAGQSTFMVEMVEAANILNHATSKSLLILDEIGRGTSTYDGVSIAWSMVEYIHNQPRLKCRTLFATHYHELTQLGSLLPDVVNYNVAVSESDNEVVFLHKIVPGGADRSYGIHVGQLAGLPRPVVQRAMEILKQLESSSGNAVEIKSKTGEQMTLFPDNNPLLDELEEMDINELSPIEALNKLYELKKKYTN